MTFTQKSHSIRASCRTVCDGKVEIGAERQVCSCVVERDRCGVVRVADLTVTAGGQHQGVVVESRGAISGHRGGIEVLHVDLRLTWDQVKSSQQVHNKQNFLRVCCKGICQHECQPL